ncbi:hypothetical protein QTP86_000671 [Hemibagrus guttatus]|nr:hypothetical protein QTP86_000671 [Hemibagrus guttatus]
MSREEPLEPMQLGRFRLSEKERQCRAKLHLFFYCGQTGHLINRCPEISSKPQIKITREYNDLREVFSKERAVGLPAHRPWDCAIDLIPNAMPPKSRVYPLSITERRAMEKYIEKALAMGYIRPSTSPAVAGFFFVGKKDGGLHPCIDYRGLNAIMVRYLYSLPLVPAALEQLRGAVIFTKLDLRSAYHLIRIREGDKWKPAFHTTNGHYEYLVMPYRLTNAPAAFQSLINEVFKDVLNKCAIVYIDDILIYSSSMTEDIQHVRTMLTRLLTHHLYVKIEKYASSCGVGAILSQKHGNPGKLHPCAFYSCKLTPAERNYHVGNRELLSIKAALEEWLHRLEGARYPFLILTDHRNLEYLCNAKRLNACQAWWALFFTRFHFSVTYCPGSKNGKADALSRKYETKSSPSAPVPVLPLTTILCLLRWELMKEIQHAHTNEPPPSSCPSNLLYVPGTLRQQVLQWVHESLSSGHPGIQLGLPTSMDTASAIFQHVFHNLGLPEDIVSDWGPQFTSRVWRSFCAQLGVNLSLTSGYHLQYNGQVERLNQKIGRKLWPKFIGPFEIIQQVNPVSFRLQLPAIYCICPTFHVSLLKTAHKPRPNTSASNMPPPPLDIDGAPAYQGGNPEVGSKLGKGLPLVFGS